MGILKNSGRKKQWRPQLGTNQTRIRFLHPTSSSSPTEALQICLKQRIPRNGQQLVSRIRCGNSASVPELDKKLEELIGMKSLSGKCKEIGGIVELVECLEREAIMGEDKGREASDYRRRAHIFDKSYRVFQALKEGEEKAPSIRFLFSVLFSLISCQF